MDPDPEATQNDTPQGEGPRPTRRIGPYRILRELGHGGMGTVYLAARADEQYEKRVALKVISARRSTPTEVVRRFRRERQILAGLDHPNIARLLDGGDHRRRPPLLRHGVHRGAAHRRLLRRPGSVSTAERLELFRRVCAAVAVRAPQPGRAPGHQARQHPGHGRRAVPKLLDFGIAKLLDPERRPKRPRPPAMAMTPAYASPEQVRGEPVTTASDVYSLGVVLYELLTGQLPYRLRTLPPPRRAAGRVARRSPRSRAPPWRRTEIAEADGAP